MKMLKPLLALCAMLMAALVAAAVSVSAPEHARNAGTRLPL
jgi:hypothetical protein